ncbi:glycosyltransferase [Desulfovibrio inopinatus]|uniref:glycosyltransferase n=1 Tax=Desulfovibrio inopinatus TaxID=102109 RepID=UPI000400A27E|nr:glycosyltransferase [Desulfovibrio inopinatus]
MTSFFDNSQIPESFVVALLAGASTAQPVRVAAEAAQQAGLTSLANACLELAVCQDPFDKNVAAQLLQAANHGGSISPVARDIATLSMNRPDAPSDRYLDRLIEKRDFSKILSYLETQLKRSSPDAVLERLRQFLLFAVGEHAFERAATVLEHHVPEPFAPWRDLVMAEMAILDAQWEHAVQYALAAWERWPTPRSGLLLAQAYLGGEERTGALDVLWRQARTYPWHTETVLRLFELETKRDTLCTHIDGSIHVALYTYNKATDLESCLRYLSRSDWSWVNGQVFITILDNASSDDTPEVVSAFSQHMADHPSLSVKTIRLPINIGAPAARNWLLSLEETKNAAWCAFLDDDALVPKDWLGRFGTAIAAYPDAGVYGCLIRDHVRQGHVQSADVFLLPEHDVTDGGRRFHISTVHLQNLDLGVRAFIRPCATVTGCCHLFKTDILLDIGNFDIRYSPSQYDDLDHDIRILLSEKTPVYQGHLAVSHLKSTGRAGAQGGAAYAMGFANQVKLHNNYTPDDFNKAINFAFQAARNDLAQKCRVLGLEYPSEDTE